MTKIYSTLSLPEASFIEMILQGEGITTEMRNEGLAGLAGEIPMPQGQIEIWIGEGDRDKALEVIGRRHHEGPSESVSCPACGEPNPSTFSVCWSCGGEIAS